MDYAWVDYYCDGGGSCSKLLFVEKRLLIFVSVRNIEKYLQRNNVVI
jgi:hypothetical protein